jgi:signal transduction histidine kinase
VRERAQRHGIALVVNVDPMMPPPQVDDRKFKQIMLNIMSNAVKFTPDGASITVTAVPSASAVAASVKDTGAGIAPGDHAAVFEEFKQVGRGQRPQGRRNRPRHAADEAPVELHGGSIHIESALGRGTTFRLMLPLRQANQSAPTVQ